MKAEELTAYLHRQIPLLAAVHAEAVTGDAEHVVLRAPLAPNRNHHETAFGGSLALMGILSGWTLLHLALEREGLAPRLMVQKSECEFLEPVGADFTAETHRPVEHWPRFVATLKRYGRGRIEAQTRIRCGSADAVLHRGTYAAVL